MIRQTLIAMLTAALLLSVSGVASAKGHASHSLKVTGLVRSLNPVNDTVTLAVRARVVHSHRIRTRLLTFAIAHAQISGQGGAVAVGERVTVTFAGSSPDQASGILVLGRANGGDGGKGAAFSGVISAIDTTSDTLTLTSAPNPLGGTSSGASSVVVQVTGTTVFAVPSAADGGQSGLADLSVGDRAVVFTGDATAVPVIAIGVLDIGHSTHQPPPPPPDSVPINGMVTALSTSSQTLTMLAPAGGQGLQARSDSSGVGLQTITVGVTASTQYGGQNLAGQVQALSDIQIGDLITVKAMAGVSGRTTALGVYDHGQPPTVGNLNHVIGSATAVDATTGTITLTVTEGPESGQTVTAFLSPHARLFVGDPAGHATLADIKVNDTVGVAFNGSFATQVTAVLVYDMTNPPSFSH
jgi:hypothetical protein